MVRTTCIAQARWPYCTFSALGQYNTQNAIRVHKSPNELIYWQLQ
jgi:hypothetical protein